MKNPVTAKNKTSKARHSLSSIDKQALTAICAVCGPTDIHQKTNKLKDKSFTVYACATKSRQDSSKYRLTHPYVPHSRRPGPNTHFLSNVDDENRTAVCSHCGPVETIIYRTGGYMTRCCKNASIQRAMLSEQKRRKENQRFLSDYKLSRGCKNCGYRGSASELQFHARKKDRRADRISRLLRLKHDRLIQELDKFDVLCKSCHEEVHRDSIPPQKPIRRGPANSRKRRQRAPLPFKHDANM